MVVVIHSDDSHKDKVRHDTVGHGHVIQYEIKSFMKKGYDSPVIICLIEEWVFTFFFPQMGE